MKWKSFFHIFYPYLAAVEKERVHNAKKGPVTVPLFVIVAELSILKVANLFKMCPLVIKTSKLEIELAHVRLRR